MTQKKGKNNKMFMPILNKEKKKHYQIKISETNMVKTVQKLIKLDNIGFKKKKRERIK